MNTVRDLISLWPKPSMAEFARDADVKWPTANQWRLRGYIPAEYWTRIIEAAKVRGIKGITVASLTAANRPPKAKPPTEPARARVG